MMAEVGKLFIGVVMMVSEDDIVQLVLLDLFFQPMDILGEVFTFKSYSDVYPVVVFLTERLETLHVAGKLFGEHPHVGYVVGTVFPGSVVRKPEYPVTAFDGTEHIVFIISGGMHATGDDEDYVLSAIKGGYRILGFSDHTPWKYRTDYVADMRMLPEELPGYVESLKTLRKKYHDRIDIRIGLECEYFPQYIHWLKEQIKKYQLDYIIFGNHHYHTDEKFPYFGHHTNSRDMLDLYEESAIEGMESGLFSCLAHPDLFMRSYPKFDHHCTTISRHICRTAARLNVPLEYNIGYVAYNEAHGLSTYPCPEFWRIAANEGCTAIIGLDAHDNKDLETPMYYDRAVRELKELKIERIDELRMLI